MRRETYYYPPSASASSPSCLVLPAISPRNGVKDFRLRFVAAFVPLCSVSRALSPSSFVLRGENSILSSSPIFYLTILRSSSRGLTYTFFAISRVAPLHFFAITHKASRKTLFYRMNRSVAVKTYDRDKL